MAPAISEGTKVYSNLKEIPIALAVWLVNDEYDYQMDPNYISATSLMKPVKQTILAARARQIKTTVLPDLEGLIPTALGHTIHSGVENAWVNNLTVNLTRLGYPIEDIKRVLVNPTPEVLKAAVDPVVVWVEQRAFKQVGKWRIGGKFDFVIEGSVQDIKSTTVYSWIKGGKDEDYILQGSIYRWLNPDKITEDVMQINFVFTDWNKGDSMRQENYPPCRVMSRTFVLLPPEKIQQFVEERLADLERYWNAPEEGIPECNASDLWLTDPQFKYYADPATASSGGRSTKNFTDLKEANDFMTAKGKGIVIPQPQTAKRCGYCDAAPVCRQKDKYQHD